jgi:hypothetical protein
VGILFCRGGEESDFASMKISNGGWSAKLTLH